jgi:cytoskeletal protein RodZ
MWAFGVFAGLLGAGALAWYIAGRDNVAPMERHLRAIDALRDLAEHPRPAETHLEPPPDMPSEHIRILDQPPAGVRPARRGTTRRATAGASRARPAARRSTKSRTSTPPSTPPDERTTIEIRPLTPRIPVSPPVAILTFDAISPPPDGVSPATGPSATAPEPGPRATQRRTALLDRINSGSRSTYAAVASAVLVVVVVLLVAAGLGNHHNRAGAARRAAAPPPPTSVAPTTTSTPTTTTPIQAASVVARSGNGATISVRSPFQITLHATGTCWVEVTDPTGRTLFNETLHSGQEQLIPGATPIVVRLGYTPAMSIAVDGVGLDLTGLSQTANLNFQTA